MTVSAPMVLRFELYMAVAMIVGAVCVAVVLRWVAWWELHPWRVGIRDARRRARR
jgi:hypothetical protein